MKKIIPVLFIALAMLVQTSPAFALELNDAKAQGLVGERPNGLLGAVSPSPDVNALIAKINAERMERYQEIANKNGTPVNQVQALAGKKLIEQTPAGGYIQNTAGDWIRK